MAPKFGNVKTETNGRVYDSAKEARRAAELRLLERAGEITQLREQVVYTLIPEQLRDGRMIERPVKYIADFVYQENGEEIVEDVKSPATRTPQYVIKRKLMLWEFGIRVREL